VALKATGVAQAWVNDLQRESANHFKTNPQIKKGLSPPGDNPFKTPKTQLNQIN
jgi:hypothetical protein